MPCSAGAGANPHCPEGRDRQKAGLRPAPSNLGRPFRMPPLTFGDAPDPSDPAAADPSDPAAADPKDPAEGASEGQRTSGGQNGRC
jgi:hypothetical protein